MYLRTSHLGILFVMILTIVTTNIICSMVETFESIASNLVEQEGSTEELALTENINFEIKTVTA